jgi:glutathione S-transferase
MELTFSATSPYARKVLIIAHELGILDKIKLVATNPRTDAARLVPLNPLSKIPVLITDAGEPIYDSPVICDYLDAEYGGHRLTGSGAPRWRALTVQALADGILDAALLVRYERQRKPEIQSAEWIAGQLKRVNDGLDGLERMAESFGDGFDLRHVATVSTVGYLHFRFTAEIPIDKRPRLAAWFKAISQRPSVQKTAPKD